ncbi:adenylosuccinate lyase [Tamlana fucoidanivorans]|uniref:Adenylosuccinate lyase n=1 Tax=Allotamlana fucoidanivorans TaxID=2583814 RepID=A0A5C4SKA1_9FLAO|nr:adenylosuccinate lyase [Tamlana fucoidanivorans]TNJ43451.1 adenylosuccinate lyase [Tamlana fucoidanivorans]
MTTKELYSELNYVNHSREKRHYYANLLLNRSDLIPTLLDILFSINDKTSTKAAWVFEFMCSLDIHCIMPYLDRFTANIKHVHFDSSVRPLAKICETLIEAYYNKKDPKIKQHLTETHKKRITAICFDFMINDEKVAVKAYSMTTLFFLGTEYEWIHPELELILKRDYTNQSAAFKARARHVMQRITKTRHSNKNLK